MFLRIVLKLCRLELWFNRSYHCILFLCLSCFCFWLFLKVVFFNSKFSLKLYIIYLSEYKWSPIDNVPRCVTLAHTCKKSIYSRFIQGHIHCTILVFRVKSLRLISNIVSIKCSLFCEWYADLLFEFYLIHNYQPKLRSPKSGHDIINRQGKIYICFYAFGLYNQYVYLMVKVCRGAFFKAVVETTGAKQGNASKI